ncbi:MAG: hypothetical protein EOM18_16550, partial [Clostridia bacterium]|nr:hypothetical protein [Clostridia bacterium]
MKKTLMMAMVAILTLFTALVVQLDNQKVYATGSYEYSDIFFGQLIHKTNVGSKVGETSSWPSYASRFEPVEVSVPMDYKYYLDSSGTYSKPSTGSQHYLQYIFVFYNSSAEYIGQKGFNESVSSAAHSGTPFNYENKYVDVSSDGWKDDIVYLAIHVTLNSIDDQFEVNVTTASLKNDFVAVYVPTLNVTFDTNGGSTVAPQEVEMDDYATEPDDPTRSGYRFDGWFTDDDVWSDEWSFTTDAVTEDITLYA